jgi:hypothetical protein
MMCDNAGMVGGCGGFIYIVLVGRGGEEGMLCDLTWTCVGSGQVLPGAESFPARDYRDVKVHRASWGQCVPELQL